MEEKKKNFKIPDSAIYIMICVCIALVVLLYIGMSDINAKLEQLDSIQSSLDADNGIQGLYSEIYNLEEKLERQASLVDDYKIKYGEADGKTLMGKVTISVVPKTYDKNTQVTVTLEDHSCKMKLEKNRFVGTMEIPITKRYGEMLFSFDNNGDISAETIDLEYDEEIIDWEYILGDVVYDCSDEDTIVYYDENKVQVNVSESKIRVIRRERCENNPTYYMVKNGEVIYQEEMAFQQNKKIYSISEDKELVLEDGERLEVYVEYVGKSGLKYRCKIGDFSCVDGELEEDYDDDEDDYYDQIYDTNGNQLVFEDIDTEEE